MTTNPPIAASEPDTPKGKAAGDEAWSRQAATLVFAATAPPAGIGTIVPAVACLNALVRLGCELPLFVVYDFQRTLSGTIPRGVNEQLQDKAKANWNAETQELWSGYLDLLRCLAGGLAIETIARRPLTVEVEAVLIARLLCDPYRQWIESSEQSAQNDPSWCLSFVTLAVSLRHFVVARSEQIDLSPLRVLGLLRGNVSSHLLDLYNMMGSTQACQSAAFSLQLLPSLLETQRSATSQRFVIDGYASVERHGNPDAMLPTELAHDDETFAHKVLNDELLYYGHERRFDSESAEHWVLVDSSASMLGMREICARGLAVSLSKKLSLRGDNVVFRFFDSRLHRRIAFSAAGAQELSYVFSFRSESGRHYARSFEDLQVDAKRSKPKARRNLAITFLTHAECHIPTPLVESLAKLARLCAVFVLPSRPLSLGYLSLLHRYHVLSHDDFGNPDKRKRRALEVMEDISLAHP